MACLQGQQGIREACCPTTACILGRPLPRRSLPILTARHSAKCSQRGPPLRFASTVLTQPRSHTAVTRYLLASLSLRLQRDTVQCWTHMLDPASAASCRSLANGHATASALPQAVACVMFSMSHKMLDIHANADRILRLLCRASAAEGCPQPERPPDWRAWCLQHPLGPFSSCW